MMAMLLRLEGTGPDRRINPSCGLTILACVLSEVDVSEEYPDDFDSVGDDDGEDDPLPFTVQRRDFAV